MNVKKRSQRREQKGAALIGGRSHPGSGSVWYRKADYSNKTFLIEDKFTDKDAYNMSLSTLVTIEKQALRIGRLPAFVLGYEKHDFEVVLLRECDCTALFDDTNVGDAEIVTTNKTRVFFSTELKRMYFNNIKKLFFGVFEFGGKSYRMLKWADFVDNQDLWGE